MRFQARSRSRSSTGPLLAGFAALLTGGGLLLISRRATASAAPPDLYSTPEGAISPETEAPELPEAGPLNDDMTLATPIVSEPALSPASTNPDDATDDETALARMLASEVSDRSRNARAARIVIGWLTMVRARRRKNPSIYALVTSGRGYGPQWDHRYASTAEKPTAETRSIARLLLSGAVQPSAAIRKHRAGSWVERGQGVSDEALLLKQGKTYVSPKDGKTKTGFDEGIYARLEGTRWVLYSHDTPPLSLAPFSTATARLDAVPAVPAVDVALS